MTGSSTKTVFELAMEIRGALNRDLERAKQIWGVFSDRSSTSSSLIAQAGEVSRILKYQIDLSVDQAREIMQLAYRFMIIDTIYNPDNRVEIQVTFESGRPRKYLWLGEVTEQGLLTVYGSPHIIRRIDPIGCTIKVLG